jgi:hypothetical protein
MFDAFEILFKKTKWPHELGNKRHPKTQGGGSLKIRSCSKDYLGSMQEENLRTFS